MSSFAIEYFILLLPPPPNPILERDYLFTNLFPSLSYTFSFLYHPPPFSPFHSRFASNNFFQSFSEVSLRQLAQIYLVTIHPCDLFFLFYPFPSSFTELSASLLYRKPVYRMGLTHQQF